jgi:hypothetical protein
VVNKEKGKMAVTTYSVIYHLPAPKGKYRWHLPKRTCKTIKAAEAQQRTLRSMGYVAEVWKTADIKASKSHEFYP